MQQVYNYRAPAFDLQVVSYNLYATAYPKAHFQVNRYIWSDLFYKEETLSNGKNLPS